MNLRLHIHVYMNTYTYIYILTHTIFIFTDLFSNQDIFEKKNNEEHALPDA